MPSPPEPVMGTEDDVLGARIGAFLIDTVGSFAVAFVVAFALVASAGGSQGGFVFTFIVANVGYFVVTEGLWGQPPGKRLLGLVVVHRDGSPCGFGGSLVRNLLRVLDGLFYYALGLVVMLVSDRRQRIGDHAARTVVVRAQ